MATVLAAEFGDAFVPLVLDVTDEAAVKAAAAKVRAALAGEKLAGLVNNASIAVAGQIPRACVVNSCRSVLMWSLSRLERLRRRSGAKPSRST
jgi:NADP-dependent 3-hydroxy acid dehydrogenase YdfG